MELIFEDALVRVGCTGLRREFALVPFVLFCFKDSGKSHHI